MDNQQIVEGTDTTTGLILASIFLVVLLLAVVVVIGVMNTANNNFDPPTDVAAVNESGLLNLEGYVFDEGDRDFTVYQVIKIDSLEVLDPGNYTIIDNKLYATAGYIC